MHHAAAGRTAWHFSVGTLLSEAAQNLTEGARVGSFASSPRRAAPVPAPCATLGRRASMHRSPKSRNRGGDHEGGCLLLAHESSLGQL